MLDMDWLEIYKSVLIVRLNEVFPDIDNDYFTKEDIAIQSISIYRYIRLADRRIKL